MHLSSKSKIASALAWAGAFLLLAAFCRADDKPDFERWEKAIAAFEKQDEKEPPSQSAILFAGSSSIRLWDLHKSFPDLDVINRGFGGSHIADSTHFAARIILKHKPRLIVLYAGDNDIAAGKTPDRVFADFKDFVKTIHAELPKTKIAFISIKPSILRWKLVDKIKNANELIEAYCKENEQLLYVDVFKSMLGKDGKPRAELFLKDGLHLNAKGYELWTSIVKPHLK